MKQMPVESRLAAFGRPILQFADREQRFRQLRLRQAVQEVALVLQRVQAFEQLKCGRPHVAALLPPEGARAALGRPGDGSAVAFAHAGIVTRRDLRRSEAHRVVEKGLELDLGIAKHIGVRCAAGLVFAQEFGEHAVLVVGCEVDVLDLDADHVGHRRRVDEIGVRRTVFAVIVVFPVLHEDADDFMALALEQPRRDGRVDAARQADDDTLGFHVSNFRCHSCDASGQGLGRKIMVLAVRPAHVFRAG